MAPLADDAPNLEAVQRLESIRAVALAASSGYIRRSPQATELMRLAGDDIRRFHARAGTLTEQMKQHIDRLSSSHVSLIRVAHQPNVIPSLAVLYLFAAQHALGMELQNRGIDPQPIYFMVDFDKANDRRFRVTRFPDPGAPGNAVPITLCSQREKRLMYSVPKPSKVIVSRWGVDLHKAIATLMPTDRTRRDRAESTLERILGHLTVAQATGESASDFNAVFLSRVLAFEIGVTVPFLNLREQRPRQAAQVTDTLSAFSEAGFSGAALWLSCEACGARMAPKPYGQRCECGSHLPPLDELDMRQVKRAVSNGLVQPRVLLDDALDSTAWECLAGVSYGGSMAHSLVAAGLLNRSRRTAVCDLYWSPRPLLEGPYEELLESQPGSGLRTLSTPATTGAYAAVAVADDWGFRQALGWLAAVDNVNDQENFIIERAQ